MAKAKVAVTMPDAYPTTTKEVLTPKGEVSACRKVDPDNTAVTLIDGNTTSIIRVADAVQDFVTKDILVKETTEQRDKSAAVLRAYAGAVRVKNAENGDYQKTLRIAGPETTKKSYQVDASDQDSFSMPKKKEDIQALRESLGDDVFKQICEQTTTIAIKKEVMEDDDLRKELSAQLYQALGAEGIKKYFDRDEAWAIKKGMAERIFSFKKKIREALFEQVTQKADSIKDATEDL